MTPSFPNENCGDCRDDPDGDWHHHCAHCGNGPTGMYGHYDPSTRRLSCDPEFDPDAADAE